MPCMSQETDWKSTNLDLSGPLPQEIQNRYLYILDLHDNGFSGNLPNLPLAYTLLTVDQSGNQFYGTFPLPQIRARVSLQSLKLHSSFDLVWSPLNRYSCTIWDNYI